MDPIISNDLSSGLSTGLAAVLVPLLVYAVVGYAVWRWWRRRSDGKYGEELLPAGDATRYALAAAVLEGSGFRRRVIDMARHRFRSKAPELGLDFPLVLAACTRFEREDRVYDWVIFGLTLTAFPFFLSKIDPYLAYRLFYAHTGQAGPTIVLVATVLLLIVIIARAVRDIGRLTPFYRETYDHAKLRQELMGAEASAVPDAFGPADNVICYGNRNPFVGLGEPVGGWTVTVELDRDAASSPIAGAFGGNGRAGGTQGAPSPVHIGELLRSVDEAVRALNIANLEMRFPVFVSGTEVAQISPLLPEKFAEPKRQADPDTLGYFWFYSDPRARSYRWYMITDWNGELVFSYLLRFTQRGQSLAIETAQLVLPPIDSKYRKVDTLRYRGILGWIGAGLSALVRSPLTIVHAAAGSLRHALETIGLARPPDNEDRKEIARSQAYNYGAHTSVREILASQSFHVYFQRTDGRQYFSAINQRVLNAITQSLADAGIDVSGLVGQAQVVINGAVTMTDQSIRAGAINAPVNTGTIGAGSAIGSNAVAQAAGAIGQRIAR